MPTWTKEQLDAIYKSNTNIIVSAGAGSGKTAVLTERVLEKLNQGIHINELLILTFTKAAAGEMKERIRSKISENPKLKRELTLIDSADITTFDAFALSLVKKYHYLLDTSVNLQITNETIIELLRKKIMREILDSFYEQNDLEFTDFISDFCIKEDNEIYKSLLEISKQLEIEVSKNEILENYPSLFFQEEKINEYIQEYEKLIWEYQEKIKEALKNLEYYVPKEYHEKCEQALYSILNERNIDVIYSYKSSKLPPLPRGLEEISKEKKEEVNSALKELLTLLEYGTKEQLRKDLKKMHQNITVLCRILKKYFVVLEQTKKQKKYYDFNDIASLASKLLDEHPEIQKELQNRFHEIMIDEYQDTNDIQENFIQKISQHNVYMVGDIKQSIYRFRNANPKLFKKKYKNYRNQKDGIKIDLVKNFRSRSEVLQNINQIFNQIMDDEIGGANYLEEHQMVFGNKDYSELGSTKENYQMEIKTYETTKDTPYTKEEIEIFTIGRDIQKKIQEGYLVFDKKKKQPRPCTYQDFVILMDRSTSFPLYKKIFNYLKIPICLYKEGGLKDSKTFYVIKNALYLLHAYHQRNFDKQFQYCFVSVARSYLFSIPDPKIYQILEEHKWYQNPIYETFQPILKKITFLSLPEIIEEIYLTSSIYEQIIKIGDIKENMLILSHIKKLAEEYGQEGNHLPKFIEFLFQIQKEEIDLKYSAEELEENCVKIMTIHKSKGLEYPICYFSGLFKTFNISDMQERFLYDKKYGIITPIKEEGLSKCFIKELMKDNYIKEEISEKIRLFYVAVTRAKEKMIFVLPNNQKKVENTLVNRLKCRSLKDFFYIIWDTLENYIQKIELDKLKITKDYLLETTSKIELQNSEEKIKVQEIEWVQNFQETKKFSKENLKIISHEEDKNIKLGLIMHEYLEDIDFKNPDYSLINKPYLRSKIKKFINSSIIQENVENKMWKEYEFIYKQEQKEYHGIIDLLIETDTKMIIIDYKLNNVLDDAYQKQLNGYRSYIEQKTGKQTEMYLYSILNETITPVVKEQITL